MEQLKQLATSKENQAVKNNGWHLKKANAIPLLQVIH
tara:strand:+ start:405 stop:515 length:111 start_codon:yes stop_codon:yes gene_type:complete